MDLFKSKNINYLQDKYIFLICHACHNPLLLFAQTSSHLCNEYNSRISVLVFSMVYLHT